MPKLVSKIDIQLNIPPKMRGIFPNEERLIIDLRAGEPTEVPKYVLDYYTKNRPHVYRDAKKSEPETEHEEKATPKPKFDPLKFLETYYNQIEEGIQTVSDWRDLLSIAKTLGLKGAHKQTKERVIERIIHDVDVKNAQREKLDKHEDSK